jgi:tetratricopeptide (TPR) repeat protein
MPTSSRVRAVIRRSADQPAWLARWNDQTRVFDLIGRTLEPGASSRDALARETARALALDPAEFRVLDQPSLRVDHIASSPDSFEPTVAVVELFAVELAAAGHARIDADSRNRWLTGADLQRGKTADLRPVSPDVLLLFEKAGLLARGLYLSRPVFISSTFRDFHAERDHLRDVVFPELQELLKQQGARLHLELIDLRQGVDTLSVVRPAEQLTPAEIDERKQSLVLTVCLDEIDRSRPFFVGLLGERYGWVAPAYQMKRVAREKGLYQETPAALTNVEPMLLEELEQTSVTALEIEYGVLRSRSAGSRAHVYFRTPLPWSELVAGGTATGDAARTASDRWHAEQGDAEAGVAAERLAVLEQRIRGRLPAERVHSYAVAWDAVKQRPGDLGEFGRMVRDHLLADLQAELRDLLARTPPTPLEEFVDHRARHFVGRTDDLVRLLTFARGGDPGAARAGTRGVGVVGEPGIGKSTLFARLHQELARPGSGLLLLAHAAGIAPQSTSVLAMLRNFVATLADVANTANPLTAQSTADEAAQVFALLLDRVAGQVRVVVLIDALDRLEPSPWAQSLTWLPRTWPPNARLIATTLPSAAVETLGRRTDMAVEPLRPLTLEEAGQILDAVSLERYRHKLNDVVRRAALERRTPDGIAAAGNALWVELAAEELNLLDADDYQRFERDLDRPLSVCERDHLERLGLDIRALARLGDVPTEFRHYLLLLDTATGLPPSVPELYGAMLERIENLVGRPLTEAFATLIVVSRSGWRESDLRDLLPVVSGEPFNELRFAQLRRGFKAHVVQRGLQQQYDFSHLQMRYAVVSRYLTQPDDSSREAGPDFLARQQALWIHLGLPIPDAPQDTATLDGARIEGLHRSVADHLEAAPREDDLRHAGLMWHLLGSGDRVRAGCYYVSISDSAEVEAATACLIERWLHDLDRPFATGVALLHGLPMALPAHQRFDLADRFNTLLYPVARHDAPVAVRLHLAEHILATLLDTRQGFDEDEKRDARADLFACVRAMIRVGDVRAELGEGERAQDQYQKARELLEPFRHAPETDRAAVVPQASLEEAQKYFKKQGSAVHPYRGATRLLTLLLNRLGDLEAQRGVASPGESPFTTALRITESSPEMSPVEMESLAVSHERLGDQALLQNELETAAEHYGRRLALAEQLRQAVPEYDKFVRDHGVALWKVGDVALYQGRFEDAARYYEQRHAIIQQLLRKAPDHGLYLRDLASHHERMGDLMAERKETADALAHYRESLAIRRKLLEHDPDSVSLHQDVYLTLQRIAQAATDLGDSERASREALEVLDRLLEKEPDNYLHQRNAAISCRQLGMVLHRLRRGPESILYILRATNLFEGIEERGRPLDPGARQLLVELRQVVAPSRWFTSKGRPADALRIVLDELAHLEQRMSQTPTLEGDFRVPLVRETIAVLKRLRAGGNIAAALVITDLRRGLGTVHRLAGDTAGAVAELSDAVAEAEGLYQAHPDDPRVVGSLASSEAELGRLRYEVEKLPEGRTHMLRAVERWADLHRRHPELPEVAAQYGTAGFLVARALAGIDPGDEALRDLFSTSHELLSQLRKSGHPLTATQRSALKALEASRRAAES